MTQQNQERISVILRHTIVAMALLGFFLATRASAQVVGGTISGTAVDPSGAVIPDVTISLKNTATGIVTGAVTNAVGFYTAPNLQPGRYELTSSAKGFMTEVRSGITLTVGQELVMNLTLRLGAATQKVTVNAQAVTVNLANSTLGGVVNQTGVSQLPLNGRSWTDLAALQPGVTLVQDQAPISAGDRVKRGLGSQLEISGGRPLQNNYLLDGVNINDYANAGPGSVLGGNLGTDAVAEFSVLTTNYDTSYGRTSGGVVSAVTKSGTNQFHGDAYEFLRNDAFDAANFFDNFANAVKPPFRRNQFGASAGGPIQKDKTFIFGDYEGIRQSLGSAVTDTVPSPAARAGNLTTGTVTVDPAAARFLNAFYPLPNGPISGDTGLYEFDAFQVTSENFFIVRADHTFSEKDRISTTYMFDFTPQNEPDEFKNKLIDNVTHRQVVAFEWNHIVSPDLMNSFRAGFNRDFTASPSGGTAVNPATADLSLGFAPGTTAGALSVGTITGFSGGLATAAPFEFHWNSWQGYDNVFYTRGGHSIKFGANIERIEDNTIGLNAPGGIMAFNSLSDFLTNHPASFIIDTPGTETPRGQRQTIFGAYFQDDFHFRSNLTINVGLRYEMASVLSEVQGKLSNLRVINKLPPKPFLGSPYIMNPTKRNFEPRVGFAWDPFKNGKTAIRGGFGIFDVLPLPVEMGPGVDSVIPFSAANTSSGVLPAGSFPTGAFNIVTSSPNTGRYYIIQFNPARNYVMQWNLNVQRQLSQSTTATVGYVGTRGVHMWDQMDDSNFVFPTQTPQGLLWPCGGPVVNGVCTDPGVGTILNTFRGRTAFARWDGNSFYDALEVQINKTMGHGFQVGGSYTWGKSIDTGSSFAAADQYRNSISGLLYFCGKCRRGLSDPNVEHDLTVNYIWEIPTPSSFGAPAKAILGGWEAGGILTVQSGSPFTATIPGDPLGMNNTDPWQYPNRIVTPGCTSDVNPGNPNQYVKVQCFSAPNPSTLLGNEGRNSLIGPGLVDYDFSLFKNIPVKRVSENFNVQFRAEFFNILNRANFRSPTDNMGIIDQFGNPIPFGGQITLTNTSSREIQFALKFTW